MHDLQVNGNKSVRFLCIYLLLCLVSPLFQIPPSAKAYNDTVITILKVAPSQLVVEEEGDPLPLVNVTIEKIEDLYAWQIRVYFDETVVNITKDHVWYPENHVFSNNLFLNITPSVSFDSHGFYVLFGSTLVGEEQCFSGSGMLCQLNFTGIASGISTLNFREEDTYLLDSNLGSILTEVVDHRQTGFLTLEPDKASLFIYEVQYGVTLSGVLTPQETNAGVTFYCKTSNSPWLRIDEVTTDSKGTYSYLWKPPGAGAYKLVAKWCGDEEIGPVVSAIETVSVLEPPPSRLPYLIVVLWIGVLIFIAYMVTKEKTSETSDSITTSRSLPSISTWVTHSQLTIFERPKEVETLNEQGNGYEVKRRGLVFFRKDM